MKSEGELMKKNDIDTVYAEIINGVLARYCREHDFDEYADYEFLAFYAVKRDDEKIVGAISGNLDSDFINGVYNLLKQISPGIAKEKKYRGRGLVDE